jgi:ABC-type oligopeptide transport system substrate-binding subunit
MVNRGTGLLLEYYDFANCQLKDGAGNFQCPPNDAVAKGVIGGSPTQNMHFRQALTQAIDKAELINNTFAGVGVPAYSPTMPGVPGFPTIIGDNTPLPYDPAEALANLATALGELGVAEPDPAGVPVATADCDPDCQYTKAWVKNLGPMRFGYNCDTGHDQRVMYLAQKWREALGFSGNEFDVRCHDSACFRSGCGFRGNLWDVERQGWGAVFPHPDNQNRDLFTCDARENSSTYCNPAYDALLNQGAEAASYAESLPFYHQAEELLVQDAPVLFLRYGESVSLVRSWVINYIQTPWDNQNVGDTFYENIQIAPH